VTIAWGFGDGQTFSGPTLTTTHTYLTAGVYPATATITDGTGRTAVGRASVTVNAVVVPPPPPPTPPPSLTVTLGCVPAAHGSVTGCNLASAFGGTRLPSDAIVSADWDFGDGRVVVRTGSPLGANTYLQAGSYTVAVRVIAIANGGLEVGTASQVLVIP
jgi:PKD repeat protein